MRLVGYGGWGPSFTFEADRRGCQGHSRLRSCCRLPAASNLPHFPSALPPNAGRPCCGHLSVPGTSV